MATKHTGDTMEVILQGEVVHVDNGHFTIASKGENFKIIHPASVHTGARVQVIGGFMKIGAEHIITIQCSFLKVL